MCNCHLIPVQLSLTHSEQRNPQLELRSVL
jgi:hypothetical protein